MDFGNLLIVWSIRLSLMLFVATLLAWTIGWSAQKHRIVQWAWTVSYLLFVLHVLAAFHFVHHWSHEHAYQATARQTRELMGLEYGEGVYFNYLFMLLWGGLVWQTWYPGLVQGQWLRVLSALSLIYLLFIAFNGVIIFKSGWLRMSGIGTTAVLLVLGVFRCWRYITVVPHDKQAGTTHSR